MQFYENICPLGLCDNAICVSFADCVNNYGLWTFRNKYQKANSFILFGDLEFLSIIEICHSHFKTFIPFLVWFQLVLNINFNCFAF